MKKRIPFLVLIIGVLAGCQPTTSVEPPTLTDSSGGLTQRNPVDVLACNLDSSVAPGQDFFLYANGGWITRNPIPPDQGSWGIGNLVIEENLKRLRVIAEKATATNASKGSPEQMIGDFWSAAMDSAGIEQMGLQPLRPYLDSIGAINDSRALLRTAGKLRTAGISTLFTDFVGQDDRNSEVMSYKLYQGGMGLPEREYYFKSDSATRRIRAAYQAFISRMLQLGGGDSTSSGQRSKAILALETRLAKASRPIEALRDPYKNHNKLSLSDLSRLSPGLFWPEQLAVAGIKGIDSVIVGQPEFLRALERELKTTPIAVWKDYLRFHVLTHFAQALPERFGQARFDFERLLSGARERRPRWKRVLQSQEDAMGELMGQLFVKEYFNEATKKRYSDLVESIRDALKERIRNLSWMSDSTKQRAFAKLAAMKKKVGYPDRWKDFSRMEIGRDSYVQNLINAGSWWHQFHVSKLGKPVDRDEWEMTPQTYNAYYNPSNNEIVLPAGIFTIPGYRDEDLDDATVYGYAGASTIGHEITHGFDDQGRQFDEQGNLKNWWTARDEAEFTRRAQVMVEQYNSYEPVKGYHINGRATLGENIADLGGVLLGLDAFKKTEQYKQGQRIAGLDPTQRYFLGYALGWQGQISEDQLRSRLLTDVHSPARYRVNGPFVSVDAFYTAFNIRPGTPMYRPDSLRVRIW
jgi:putative endopeptidase